MGLIKTVETKGKGLLTKIVTSVIKTPQMTRGEIMAVPPRRILVIRQHNQMGDMLLAVPALRAIKESLPGATLTVLTAPINRDVMINNPYVDTVVTYNSRRPLGLIPLVRHMRRAKYEMVIVLHTVSFSFSSAVLGLLSGSRLRVGSTSAPFGNSLSESFFHLSLPLPSEDELAHMNEAEHNLYPLAALGVYTSDIAPVLVPTEAEDKWATDFVSEHSTLGAVKLLVHPGAGKVQNIWPAARFAETVNLLAKRVPLSVVVVEGPRDAETVAEFSRRALAEQTVLRGRSIGDVAAVMRRCDLVLCNDTGVMHVASAAGARTLAIFGPTDPSRWAPRCPNLHILRAKNGKLVDLTAAEVVEEVLYVLEEVRSG